MAGVTPTSLKTTAIQTPSDKNHTLVLRQLKEVAEVGQRLRGDPQDSFVRVSELVNSGLFRLVNGTLQPPTTTSLPGTVVPSTRKVNTAGSLTGGGTLAADLTLQLSGDSASPGNLFYYGTSGSGVKGFFSLTSAIVVPTPQITIGAAWVASSGAVTVPTVDVPRVVPYNCTLKEVNIVTRGGPGSCTVDIWKAPIGSYPPTVANSITGGTPPAISSANTYTNTTLTGWTTAFSLDDVLMFHISASTTFTFVSIQLRVG